MFETGSSLTISNCIIKDFVEQSTNSDTTGDGILIDVLAGTINFTIVNTTPLNNQVAGIAYAPAIADATVTGAIDRVVASHNGAGILINPTLVISGSTAITISNSEASNNTGGSGIKVSGPVTVTIDNDQLSNNQYGVYVGSSMRTATATPSRVLHSLRCRRSSGCRHYRSHFNLTG